MTSHRGRGTDRTGRERGAVLMEAAFVFPVLFMVVFAMITYGQALGQKNGIENAAREASRYAARHPVDTTRDEWLDDILGVAIASATGDLGPGAPNREICVALSGTAGNDGKVTVIGSASPTYASGTCPGVTCPPSKPCTQVTLARTADVDAVFFRQTIDIEAASVSLFEREP